MQTAVVTMLLDRTGSMEPLKQETISGVNAYWREVRDARDRPETKATLIQFDSQSTDVTADNVDVGMLPDPVLNDANYVPRSMTPLYDAIAAAIARTEEAIKEIDEPKVAIVVMTDGHENASFEFDLAAIRKRILAKESEGWAFAWLASGPDAWDSIAGLSRGTASGQNVHNVVSDGVGRTAVFSAAAEATSSYTGDRDAKPDAFYTSSGEDAREKKTGDGDGSSAPTG